MSMSRILITGANGYIGARLAKFLALKGHSITALCYPNRPEDREWTDLMEKVLVGDIRHEKIMEVLGKSEYDNLIHLISFDHHQTAQKSINEVISVNVLPTARLLELFGNKNLKNFIYFSTFHVYGAIEAELVREEHKTIPKNIYGLTHLMSEQFCTYYHENTNINCLSLRLSNSYGSPVFMDANCWWLVINELCRDAYHKNLIELKSDGSPLRDFIHYNDICAAVELLISNEIKLHEPVFNLCSGITRTILELAHTVREVYRTRYNKDIPVYLPDKTISEDPSRFSHIKRFRIDNSGFLGLGMEIRMDLESGIHELYDYLEK